MLGVRQPLGEGDNSVEPGRQGRDGEHARGLDHVLVATADATCGETVSERSGWATTSYDGRYRYLLGRSWGHGPRMLWVLANPSTADALDDDPTVRRCVGFATRHGYGGLLVVNLWAWRATDPRELARVADPVGRENDAFIAHATRASSGPVVLGWGARGERSRVDAVLALLGDRPVRCLGVTRSGHPRHPLYVSRTTRLRPW